MNWCVDAGRIGGRRIRRRFPTQEQAEMWVKENESISRVRVSSPAHFFVCQQLSEFLGSFLPQSPNTFAQNHRVIGVDSASPPPGSLESTTPSAHRDDDSGWTTHLRGSAALSQLDTQTQPDYSFGRDQAFAQWSSVWIRHAPAGPRDKSVAVGLRTGHRTFLSIPPC
jgi:hypothetical protein